jgi:DnaK suppressor protein
MSLDSTPYQTRLRAELDELIMAIARDDGATDTVELDQTRVGRLSRMDALQQQAMAQGARGRQLNRQRRLEAALARIAAGTYGYCCECHGPLSEQRLNTDPAVVFCVDCAEAREMR